MPLLKQGPTVTTFALENLKEQVHWLSTQGGFHVIRRMTATHMIAPVAQP